MCTREWCCWGYLRVLSSTSGDKIFMQQLLGCVIVIVRSSSYILYASPLPDVRECVPSRFGHVRLLATPWTVACQALSMGFSRQEYWRGLPCPISRGSSPPRGQTRASCVSCNGRQVLHHLCQICVFHLILPIYGWPFIT